MVRRALEIFLATPRGFCAGVERAIDIVELTLRKYGAPVYVRHEIVHNKRVCDTLRAKGAIFVKEVDEIPVGAIAITSAHGVAKKVEANAALRQLDVIDATCPLVTKVHKEGQRYVSRGYEVILIGHLGHPEVTGTLGQIDGQVHVVGTETDVAELEVSDPEKVAFVTQTTLSLRDTRGIIDALKTRFPAIIGPDTRDICYATQNRQTAVVDLASRAELLLIVGAQNSSNSNRLREIGEEAGLPSYLVADAEALDPQWFEGVSRVGISAGASAPEELVREVVERIGAWHDVTERPLDGTEENIHFKLPARLASLQEKAQPNL
ncbi:4-hydroxy-3-methylbut-2-enyl diphosphate reductase [Parvularcula sp. ZS-1/3]|uniref:4-hydroxy-3-methylbut-2-enyl diphosphate reductase n=1 Tax=Parvularcula mediterranea TaxID=2732508 RepID=A0A7Y3RLA4_9PROT|nr:4-hydroxy-3-methylbut-2-enyl diphosphate reductase [Parvularcula mediterranea]NNU15690.1 4-hydroxy-3-methylbut-2-enyl diphosphate reductase [Parvularcula mediterranea]